MTETREPASVAADSDEPTDGGAVREDRIPLDARLDAASIESTSAFQVASGLHLDEIGPTRVVGHIDLGPEHHQPWGIVHGGIYASAVESTASVGASAAVIDRGQVAVGLTNTTHFLRAVTAGRVVVEAVAVYQGRTHQLWQVSIADESGRLVAHGELRLQNVAADRKR